MPRKNKYANGFREVTYTDGHDEVMVHFDRKNESVIDVYTYRDARFLVGDRIDPVLDLTSQEKRLRWTAGKNPMFLHASNPNVAFKYLNDCGFMVTGEDETDGA